MTRLLAAALIAVATVANAQDDPHAPNMPETGVIPPSIYGCMTEESLIEFLVDVEDETVPAPAACARAMRPIPATFTAAGTRDVGEWRYYIYSAKTADRTVLIPVHRVRISDVDGQNT